MATEIIDPYQQIEDIDNQLISLLAKRAELYRSIASSDSIFKNSATQAEVISGMLANICERAASKGLAPEFAKQLWQKLIADGCSTQAEIVAVTADDDVENMPGASRTILSTMALRIDHVTIAVRDINGAIEHYRDRLGFRLRQRTQIDGDFSGMQIAVMEAGEVKFVLVAPTTSKSHIAQYINNYGIGVQHLAIEVRDLGRVQTDLKLRQFPLLGEVVHSNGLDQIFSYRDANSGMQLEFVQRSGETGLTRQNMTALFRFMERERVY